MFGFVGIEPREPAVERDEAGLALEDPVEPRPQCCLALFGRGATIRSSPTFSKTGASPSFLHTTPAKKPRTECCCHPVTFMIAAIVVPCGRLGMGD
jgi:hypothetical protein